MNNLKKQYEELKKGALTIPNLLSLIRIILVPIFIVLFCKGEIKWALLMLVLSGLTDFVDGKIARKFNQISNLGKILDPIADKLTQITIAVLLFIQFNHADDSLIHAFSYVFLLFLGKDALMIIGGFILIAMDLRPGAAEMPGKVSTFTFYTVMIIIICFGPHFGAFSNYWTIPDTLLMVLVIIAAALTIFAFLSYLPSTYHQIKERKNCIKDDNNTEEDKK